MKKNVYTLAFATLLLIFLITACQDPIASFNRSDDEGTIAQYTLPPDTIEDELRGSASSFSFETLYQVDLELAVVPFVGLDNGDAVPVETGSTRFAVSLEDSSGNLIFEGRTAADGVLQYSLYVPSIQGDVILKIQGDNYEPRRIQIGDLAEYTVIDRTVNILQHRSRVIAMSLEGSGGFDDDGDSVPNDFDSFPDDPERAFVASVPAEGSITVAYEDLFGRANAGDADYNDFIVSYKLKIITNGDNRITDIEFNDITLVQKIAGYSHRFGFRIDSFTDTAVISGNSISGTGALRPIYQSAVQAPAEITLFEKSSNELIGETTSFTISFNQPQRMLSDGGASTLLSPPPFNPYIYVHNTGHDIHLIDAEPLSASINPDDDFRDDEGFPWALLIPSDWEHPAEGQRIEEVYPRFTSWRESWGDRDVDWYVNEASEPRANLLIYASDQDGDDELFSLDLDSGEVSQITSNSSVEKHPALSSDGSRIAFVSNMSGNWAIHTMASDGSELSGPLYVLDGSFDGRPSWSPDGTRIVFDSDFDIFIMNFDGSGVVNLTDTVFTNEYGADWSPLGTEIAYVSKADGDPEIYIRPFDGSGMPYQQLTQNSLIDEAPNWAPDGSQIVYINQNSGQYDLVSINTDGTGVTNLSESLSLDELAPDWSENGIVFERNGDIFSIDPNGLTIETLVSGPPMFMDPSW